MGLEQRHSTEEEREEFELYMAQLLCRELDAEGRARLTELVRTHAEFYRRYKEYVSMHKLLHRFRPATLEKAFGASGASTVIPFPAKDVKKEKKSLFSDAAHLRWLSLAAALPVALALGFGIYFGFHTKASHPQRIVLRYAFGACLSGGKRLRAGGVVQKELSAQKNSLCDIGITGGEGGRVALRLFPESRISLMESSAGQTVWIERGSLMVKAEKRSTKDFAVYSDGYRVQVLGTRFLVERLSRYKLRVDMIDGAAQVTTSRALYSRKLIRLEDDSLRKELPLLFSANEQVLEKGQGALLVWDARRARDAFDVIKKLEEKMQHSPSIRENRVAATSDTKEILATLQSSLDPDSRMALKRFSLAKKTRYRNPQRKLTLLKKAASGLELPDDLSERRDTADSEASASRPNTGTPVSVPADEILRAFRKKDLPALVYRFYLKDGRVVNGLAVQHGNSYKVETSDGPTTVSKKDVKKIEVYVE